MVVSDNQHIDAYINGVLVYCQVLVLFYIGFLMLLCMLHVSEEIAQIMITWQLLDIICSSYMSKIQQQDIK